MKIIPLAGLAIMLALPTAALAQSRTYQDNMSRETGRSVTSGNNAARHDAMDRNTGRSVTSGDRTIVYDRMGRQVGPTPGKGR